MVPALKYIVNKIKEFTSFWPLSFIGQGVGNNKVATMDTIVQITVRIAVHTRDHVFRVIHQLVCLDVPTFS